MGLSPSCWRDGWLPGRREARGAPCLLGHVAWWKQHRLRVRLPDGPVTWGCAYDIAVTEPVCRCSSGANEGSAFTLRKPQRSVRGGSLPPVLCCFLTRALGERESSQLSFPMPAVFLSLSATLGSPSSSLVGSLGSAHSCGCAGACGPASFMLPASRQHRQTGPPLLLRESWIPLDIRVLLSFPGDCRSSSLSMGRDPSRSPYWLPCVR